MYSYDVIMKCWEELPDKRPSFAELVVLLSTLLEEIAGYLDFSVLNCSMEKAQRSNAGYDHLEALEAKTLPESKIEGYDHLEVVT